MDYSSDKRAKRFEQKKRHVKRQVDILKVYGVEYQLDQPHRFHKRKALNCGDPKCVMCSNPRKVFGEKTFQERKFEAIAEED